MTAPPDRRGGPEGVRWFVSPSGRTIYDECFAHDAKLRLDGDFGEDAERKAFADSIAAALNATPPASPVQGAREWQEAVMRKIEASSGAAYVYDDMEPVISWEGMRTILAEVAPPPAADEGQAVAWVNDSMVERAVGAYLLTGEHMTCALMDAFASEAQVAAARKAFEQVYDVEIFADGTKSDNRSHAMRAALLAAMEADND